MKSVGSGEGGKGRSGRLVRDKGEGQATGAGKGGHRGGKVRGGGVEIRGKG